MIGYANYVLSEIEDTEKELLKEIEQIEDADAQSKIEQFDKLLQESIEEVLVVLVLFALI